ncbi:hypothetical protein DCAR_0729997 [Daucus carota subsp. sativus]|uniref:Cyclic nucleotide-binding domain-containing protein n=1 Tax=Daucus carota subsp. sativus TaxID=79200 RepID=A0AAF0XM24_DAUCS|nr:hypothetical protein DCAR_0729997 [Daucus carota subsp. sativus]
MNEQEKHKANPVFRRSISRMRSPSSLSIAVNSLEPDDHKFSNTHGWARRILSSLNQCIPGVMNPYAQIVQKWNNILIFSYLFSGLFDSLFLFLLSAKQGNNCIAVNQTTTKALIFLRSVTNFFYLLRILVKFRLAYVAPGDSGSYNLVDHPKKIALNYLSGYFLIDFFVVLPLSQVIMGLVLQKSNGHSGANDVVNVLQVVMIFQYMAMLSRVVPMLVGQSQSSFLRDSWSTKFVICLVGFVLFSHMVGSCWYLFALQRIDQCLRNVCSHFWCLKYIYCQQNDHGRFREDPALWKKWKDNTNATACFGPENFNYGIYVQAVSLTTKSLPMRYIYSLFWGFQQISTLAGNQTPAFSVLEVLFTMFITATGLLLFSLLIGNMQNFVQALGRRSLEMFVRRLDVEQWMSHMKFPDKLKMEVYDSERYEWTVTRGLNESMLMENLPEVLQKNIRRHRFEFVRKSPIFSLMHDSILDAIFERLKRKTYLRGHRIMVCGDLIDKMFFIVQGKLEIIGKDKNVAPLHEGEVCGEELITLLVSNRLVRCLTNVQAYTIQVADLEEVISLYSGFLSNNPHIQANRFKLSQRSRDERM